MLHICLAFQDTQGVYTTYAATTLLSCCEHSSTPLHIHILHDTTLTSAQQTALTRIATHGNARLDLHNIESIHAKYQILRTHARYGAGSLYRFYIPQCIPREQVLYLDCDILVLTDIKTVFDAANAQEFLLACVADRGARDVAVMKKHVLELGIDPRQYFNTGVLLFDSGRINALFPDFAKTCHTVSAAHQQSDFVDQDALNQIFFKLPKVWLPEYCNTFMDFAPYFLCTQPQLAGRILHFTGNKPWEDQRFPAAQIFLEYHRRACQIMHCTISN